MTVSKILGGILLLVAITGCSGSNEKLVIPKDSPKFSEVHEQSKFIKENFELDENLQPVKPKLGKRNN